MKEIVIISGKGGTGKTSLTAAFAGLARNAVFADCDVDGADLHLILRPTLQVRTPFYSGHEARIGPDACARCGVCAGLCRYGAILEGDGGSAPQVDPTACEGCGVCVHFCPVGAIAFPERLCGEWMISHSRFGPLVHARLEAAAENSGKLVSLTRREARRIAEERGADLILIDGPPGIGCPVIASITGADAVLAVTEPSLSGEHDVARILELARHFHIPAWLCVNKWDINPTLTDRIEASAARLGAPSLGRIPYDRAMTAAQLAGQTVIEAGDGPAAEAIAALWDRLAPMLYEEHPITPASTTASSGAPQGDRL